MKVKAKVGMVSSTCDSNTEESKNCQELKASLGYMVNTRLAWAT